MNDSSLSLELSAERFVFPIFEISDEDMIENHQNSTSTMVEKKSLSKNKSIERIRSCKSLCENCDSIERTAENLRHYITDKPKKEVVISNKNSEYINYKTEVENESLSKNSLYMKNSLKEPNLVNLNMVTKKDGEYSSFLQENSLSEEERERYELKYLLTNSLKLNNKGNWDITQGALLYSNINVERALTDAEKLNLELFNQTLLPEYEKIDKTVEKCDSDDQINFLYNTNSKIEEIVNKKDLNKKLSNIFTKKNKKYVDHLIDEVRETEKLKLFSNLNRNYNVANKASATWKEEDNDIQSNESSRIDDTIYPFDVKKQDDSINYRKLINQELIDWCKNEFKMYEKMNLYEDKNKFRRTKRNNRNFNNKFDKTSNVCSTWPNCSKYPKFKIDSVYSKRSIYESKNNSFSELKDNYSKQLSTSHASKKHFKKNLKDYSNVEISKATSKHFSFSNKKKSYGSFNDFTESSNCSKHRSQSLDNAAKNTVIDSDIIDSSQNIKQSINDRMETELKDESTLNDKTIDFSEKNQIFNKLTYGKVKSMTKKTKLKKKKIKSFQEQSPKSNQIGQGKKVFNRAQFDKSTGSSFKTTSGDLQGRVKLRKRTKFSSISTEESLKCQTRILRRGKQKKTSLNEKRNYEYPSSQTIELSKSSSSLLESFDKQEISASTPCLVGPGIPLKKDENEISNLQNSIPFGILNSSFKQSVEENLMVSNLINPQNEKEISETREISDINKRLWRNDENWPKLKLGFIGNQSLNNALISILKKGTNNEIVNFLMCNIFPSKIQ